MSSNAVKLNFIRLLRITGLLAAVDRIRFTLMKARNQAARKRFETEHPDIILPPDHLMYETYGKLDYQRYIYNGRETAQELLSLFGQYIALRDIHICEWGCGAARLLRHMREMLDSSVQLTGTDYDDAMIRWASAKFHDIRFMKNDLMPPIAVAESSFDIVFAISVMTHLPSDTQGLWLKECLRILKSGGLFIFSVHGDTFINYFLPDERKRYETGGYVVKQTGGEGSKNYVSFTSPRFMRNVLLKDCDIVTHLPGTSGEQDIWVVRK